MEIEQAEVYELEDQQLTINASSFSTVSNQLKEDKFEISGTLTQIFNTIGELKNKLFAKYVNNLNLYFTLFFYRKSVSYGYNIKFHVESIDKRLTELETKLTIAENDTVHKNIMEENFTIELHNYIPIATKENLNSLVNFCKNEDMEIKIVRIIFSSFELFLKLCCEYF